MYHKYTLTVHIEYTQLTKGGMTESKPILGTLNPTPSYPTSLPEIVDSLPVQEVLGLFQEPTFGSDLDGVTKHIRKEHLDELALKYDWTKKEITEENFEEYQAWLTWRLQNKRKGRKGKRHYKSRRLRMKIRNYERDDELKRLQQAYRDSIYGKWVFKKKLCKQRKVEFKVTYEEYEHWLVSLGNVPGTNIPYWKLTGKHPDLGLKVGRIDTTKPFQTDNVKFTYKGEFICNAVDLPHLTSEPKLNKGV